MAVTTTSSPNSNAVASLYQAAYMLGVQGNSVFCQSPVAFTPPQGVLGVGNRGSAVVIPMFVDLDKGSSLSQTADVTPVQMYPYQATITPELYGLAVQLSQKLSLTSFTDVERAAVEEIARSAAKTREILAREALQKGANVAYGGDATSRIALSTASTADTISYDNFTQAAAFLAGHCPKLPGAGNGYAAIMDGLVEAELVSTGAIMLAAEYGTRESLMTGEIGTHLSGTRILRSDFGKIFRGGGSSGSVASGTIQAALVPGSTVMYLNVFATAAIGDYVVLGQAEISSAYDYGNTTETVRVVSGSTGTSTATALGIIGAGVNGGCMYAHSSGDLYQHHLDAHAVYFVGSESLGQVYSNEDGLGPEGKLILPEVTGILHQFNNIGFSGFWGYGISAESRVYRLEVACSYKNVGH